ncbi:MAG: hypothetical protein HOI23_03695 [Deltaproteobacteria bacterium]|nr:hypothetical protein [Deltaproteobacteria bacterium]MBT6434303.1 hypothetical protein [Deltaproteobacteria bacterium]
MKHLGLVLALMAMSTNVLGAARVGGAMTGTAVRATSTASTAGTILSTVVWHDGTRVTESYAEQFVKGEMLTWGTCDADARRQGACDFYVVEKKSNGSIQTLMMTENTCQSSRAFCRNGYVASLRTKTSSHYNSATNKVDFETKMWRSFQSRRGGLTTEKYAGHIEGSLGRNSYDYTSYDANGAVVDSIGGSMWASGDSFIDLCTYGFETSITAGGMIGAGIGPIAAAALGDMMLGLAALVEGSVLGGLAGGTLTVGVVIAESPVIVGVAAAAVIVGAAFVALNYWCEPDVGDGPDVDVPTGGDDAPTFETPDGEGCEEDEYWGAYEYECGYETYEEGVSDDGYYEMIVTYNSRTCIGWSCLPF